MLCSPFYVFKNIFQKQTKDNDSVEVKSGGLCKTKFSLKMLHVKSLVHIKFAK